VRAFAVEVGDETERATAVVSIDRRAVGFPVGVVVVPHGVALLDVAIRNRRHGAVADDGSFPGRIDQVEIN
jgi:hypothetical protein